MRLLQNVGDAYQLLMALKWEREVWEVQVLKIGVVLGLDSLSIVQQTIGKPPQLNADRIQKPQHISALMIGPDP